MPHERLGWVIEHQARAAVQNLSLCVRTKVPWTLGSEDGFAVY